MSRELSSYFYLKIGENDLTLNSFDYIISFDMTRGMDDTSNDISLVLFDPTAMVMEWEILKGYDKVKFRYGRDDDNISKMYNAVVKDYEVELTNGGAMLSLQCFLGENGDVNTAPKTYKGTPSEIVRQICTEEGWQVGNVVETEKADKEEFIRSGKTPLQFINDELVPIAKSKSGQTNYVFYFDKTATKPIANFKPMKESSVTDARSFEYIIGKHYNNIISFTPAYNGLMYNLFSMTPQDNSDTASTDGGVANTSVSPYVPSLDSLTNKLIMPYEPSKEFKKFIGTSSYDNGDLGKISEYLFTKMLDLCNTAQLELTGDATIEIPSFVAITVLTKDGFFHHSSGLYQVLEIVDHVEEGDFTTTLNMIKRPMKVDENGNFVLLDVNDAKFIQADGSSSTGSSTNESNSSGSGTASVNSVLAQKFKNTIDPLIGLPYTQVTDSTHNAPNGVGYDCSGFVREVYRRLGVNLSRSTHSQYKEGTAVKKSRADLRPGDLLYKITGGSNHVVMYIEGDTIAHSPTYGKTICYSTIGWFWNSVTHVRRHVNNGSGVNL